MKPRYLGIIIAGALAIGSLSVFAGEIKRSDKKIEVVPLIESAEVEKIKETTLPQGTENGTLYNDIKAMIDQQVELGNFTEEEAKEMIEYCVERMSNSGSSRCH